MVRVRIGGRGSCNNDTSGNILGVLKAIKLGFTIRKTTVH